MGKVLHRKKLFGGRQTAEEVHSQHAFPPGAKCAGCSSHALITRIMTFAPVDELKKRDPFFAHLAEYDPQKFLELVVQTKHGPHIRMATIYACKRCTPAAERAAAKGPSWMIVDINGGPGADKVVTSG